LLAIFWADCQIQDASFCCNCVLGYLEQIVKLRVQILFLVSLNFGSAQKEFEGINFGSIHREFGGIKNFVCP